MNNLENAVNEMFEDFVANVTEETERESAEFYQTKTTPADGQGLCSIIYAACLACALRIISENDFYRLCELMKSIESIEELVGNREAMRIINRIPKAFQVRHKHTGVKGMLIVYPLELVEQTKGIDVIITAGLSKYGNQKWDTADIEVCAYLKKKSEWVSLNVQFINALVEYDNPAFLLPIVDYWHNFAKSTLTNEIAKMKFHNIVASFGEEERDNDLRLATALKTNISLRNERYMLSLARDQYEKFYTGLECGRMAVPGRYTYEVTDPAYMLNQLFGTDIECLKSGEYWMNGKTCLAGLFRSPMIAPFEAQKVKLVSHSFYDVFYKDIVMFNGYDGIWELMGGSDFDGDTCACIPEDTTLGKIIVDSIKKRDYVIKHESRTAQYVKFNKETFWEDLAKFNAVNSKPDRTGLITNYATKGIEIWHHIKSCIYYAKANGCVGIYMRHPNQMQKDDEGHIINVRPHSEMIEGEKWYVIRGLVYATKDTGYKWTEEFRCGKYSFEELEDLMYKFLLKVEYLNPVQGDEIDGAKTGYYPEIIQSIMVAYQSDQMTKRNIKVGKPVGKSAKLNSYWSYSPLSIVHDYSAKCHAEFNELMAEASADKTAMLKNLLTEDELKSLDKEVTFNDFKSGIQTTASLIDYFKDRKTNFNERIRAIMSDNTRSEDEKKADISALRDGYDELIGSEIVHHKGEKELVLDIAKNINVSNEVIAVAMYMATNETSTKTRSWAYGWMLFDEILSIFARANGQCTLYRVPSNTENVCIINKELFVNDKKFAVVDADDCEFVPVQNINGRLFALVKSHNEENTFVGSATVGKTYCLGSLVGFKYNGLTTEDFKQLLAENGHQFEIEYDSENNLVAVVNGRTCCRIQSNNAVSRNTNELVGHIVVTAPSPNFEAHENSYKNLCVTVLR